MGTLLGIHPRGTTFQSSERSDVLVGLEKRGKRSYSAKV